METRIIVIDDEQDFLDSVKRGLITSGIKKVHTETNAIEAASAFKKGEAFDLALIDINMPGIDGVVLLQIIKNQTPSTECIMVTALDEAATAVSCLKKGAYDYLVKPVSMENMLYTINRALERKRLMEILDLGKSKRFPKLENQRAFKSIITQSQNMLRILREAELHSASDIPILITGETGTGKELLSRSIHAASPRSSYDFTAINMESFNPQLFESQFFGHNKGAFTGADKKQIGYLESNKRGTLFLDEIGNLPIELQGKLLRVLQEAEYFKIGSTFAQKVNARFIAATNADLEGMIKQNRFRKDLYYRLKGGWLHIPPLRERKSDIPLLINHFISEFSTLGGINIEQEVVSALINYDYPGNVRELKSTIHSAVNLANGKTITTEMISQDILNKTQFINKSKKSDSESILPLKQVEKKYILKAYNKFGKNKSQTARALGISLNTLKNKLNSYGMV
jgi:DNA-binding NtrC family response regulator